MGLRRWTSSAVAVLLICVPTLSTAGAPPLSSAGPILVEMGRRLEDQRLPPEERLQIIKVFGEWATEQVRPPLVAVLKDPRPEIRGAAAQALGWHGNDEAVPPLRERVETPAEVTAVKAAAVRSLGRIGDRSVRALVITLTGDTQASVREAAVWGVALGSLTDPADRTSYLMQFAEDRAFDAQSRAEAVRHLAGVNEERVVASLSRILEHEPRLTVALPSGRPTELQVMTLRYTQARDVAAFAAGALGQLEAKTALPLLLKAAEEPSDFFLRLVAVRSLAVWKAPEALPVFVRRLEDPLPEVRVSALIGLERLGDPKAVDAVLTSFSDGVPAVRAQAVRTLATLGGPSVRPQLEALEQKESDPDVRGALETAFSRLAR